MPAAGLVAVDARDDGVFGMAVAEGFDVHGAAVDGWGERNSASIRTRAGRGGSSPVFGSVGARER